MHVETPALFHHRFLQKRISASKPLCPVRYEKLSSRKLVQDFYFTIEDSGRTLLGDYLRWFLCLELLVVPLYLPIPASLPCHQWRWLVDKNPKKTLLLAVNEVLGDMEQSLSKNHQQLHCILYYKKSLQNISLVLASALQQFCLNHRLQLQQDA